MNMCMVSDGTQKMARVVGPAGRDTSDSGAPCHLQDLTHFYSQERLDHHGETESVPQSHTYFGVGSRVSLYNLG